MWSRRPRVCSIDQRTTKKAKPLHEGPPWGAFLWDLSARNNMKPKLVINLSAKKSGTTFFHNLFEANKIILNKIIVPPVKEFNTIPRSPPLFEAETDLQQRLPEIARKGFSQATCKHKKEFCRRLANRSISFQPDSNDIIERIVYLLESFLPNGTIISDPNLLRDLAYCQEKGLIDARHLFSILNENLILKFSQYFGPQEARQFHWQKCILHYIQKQTKQFNTPKQATQTSYSIQLANISHEISCTKFTPLSRQPLIQKNS